MSNDYLEVQGNYCKCGQFVEYGRDHICTPVNDSSNRKPNVVEPIACSDNAKLTINATPCSEYVRLSLCWGEPRHSSSNYSLSIVEAKDLADRLNDACSSIVFEGIPGLHANIQCYVRDLTNGINSPLVRENIDSVIPQLSRLEMNWAHSAASGVLTDPWDNPLIDSLLDSLSYED